MSGNLGTSRAGTGDTMSYTARVGGEGRGRSTAHPPVAHEQSVGARVAQQTRGQQQLWLGAALQPHPPTQLIPPVRHHRLQQRLVVVAFHRKDGAVAPVVAEALHGGVKGALQGVHAVAHYLWEAQQQRQPQLTLVLYCLQHLVRVQLRSIVCVPLHIPMGSSVRVWARWRRMTDSAMCGECMWRL